MSDEPTRAGANPAEPAPKTAQFETLSANAVNRAVALAIVHLEETLMSSRLLLEHCKVQAKAPSDESLAAIRSGVRLVRNQSDAAEALARVARGESRHRTIVEYADGAKPEARLNSKFLGSPPPAKRGAATNGKANGNRKANGRASE